MGLLDILEGVLIGAGLVLVIIGLNTETVEVHDMDALVIGTEFIVDNVSTDGVEGQYLTSVRVIGNKGKMVVLRNSEKEVFDVAQNKTGQSVRARVMVIRGSDWYERINEENYRYYLVEIE